LTTSCETAKVNANEDANHDIFDHAGGVDQPQAAGSIGVCFERKPGFEGASRRKVYGRAVEMKLPNVGNAMVEKTKIMDYLLNMEHQLGGSKARFFRDFGFGPDNWEVFQKAIMQVALDNEIVSEQRSPFGLRYEVDGVLNTPSGLKPRIRTVWQQDEGARAPRFITAYPLEKEP
jgi:hypothetical protein